MRRGSRSATTPPTSSAEICASVQQANARPVSAAEPVRSRTAKATAIGARYVPKYEIERRAPERLALVHFGVADDVARHLGELRRRLREWVALAGVTEEEFAETVRMDVEEIYERAMPFWQSYAGLKRYWEKRAA